MPASARAKRKNAAQKKLKKGNASQVDAKPKAAERLDRHALYERSVQCVEAEIDFVDETFKALRGRDLTRLREDFCGTGNTSVEFIKRRPTNTAIGVDLDQPTLDWGLANHVAKLSDEDKSRVNLINDNVLTVDTTNLGGPVDAVLAMNFSYFIFQTRDSLRGYFEHVLKGLVDDGMLILDCYGGSESFAEAEDKRIIEPEDGMEVLGIKKFTYVWDQHSYNPVTGEMVCHIHFHFPDGSKMKRAFTYTWRLWTLPELRELLAEAGFSKVTVYWEGTDEDTNEGNGEYAPTEEGDADPAWVSYIVAEK